MSYVRELYEIIESFKETPPALRAIYLHREDLLELRELLLEITNYPPKTCLLGPVFLCGVAVHESSLVARGQVALDPPIHVPGFYKTST